MTNLNIKEADLITDVRNIQTDILEHDEKKQKSEFLFFGNIDIPMQEIDAAIKKLEQLSAKRHTFIPEGI